MLHYLKQWPQYFEQVRLKRKTFEIRKDDRGFMEGDQLVLEEWVPTEERPAHHPPRYDSMPPVQEGGSTGRFIITGPIPYIMRGPNHGLDSGYVIMSLVDAALMEAPDGSGRRLTRVDVEAYMDRVRTIQQFQGTLNRRPGLVPEPNS